MVNVWEHFCEYAGGCTVHGVKYLAESTRHWFEKLCWIIAFVISISCCIELVWNIYEKWTENPVLVSFDEKPTPVWTIPFPAVTICPQAKTNSDLINMTEAYFNMANANSTLEKWDQLEMIFQTCDYESLREKFREANYGGVKVPATFTKYIDMLAPKLDKESPLFLFWRGEQVPYRKILTDIGICYTFNILKQEDIYKEESIQQTYDYIMQDESMKMKIPELTEWSLEKGYKKQIFDDSLELRDYPYRVFTSNDKDSLTLIAGVSDKDLDYICAGPIQGFKVLFHTPSDIPSFSGNYFHLLNNHHIQFNIKPEISKTTSSLKGLTPHKRQCFYNDEKFLRYFKVYSQHNCELECLANFTLEYCGCVKFSFPSAPEHEICGFRSISCYSEVEYFIPRQQQIQAKKDILGKSDCDCLPACNTIEYDGDSRQFSFQAEDFNKKMDARGLTRFKKHEIKWSTMRIAFDNIEYTASKRSLIYGYSDFIANCGGLLGVFMGISILSIVEIIYFFSLRLICNEELQDIEDKKNAIEEKNAENGKNLEMESESEKIHLE